VIVRELKSLASIAALPASAVVAVVTLALALPTSTLAAEEATSQLAPASTTGETTSTAAEAPAPTTSTPAPTTTTSTPAPTTGAPPPTAATPQVSAQSEQGNSRTAGKAGRHARGQVERAGTKREQAASTGANASPRRGKRAPKPSALTPPLPLSLSSSIAGVPAFFIESFRIPPFLLPIYQAAGTAYGVPWQVLAAINEVETDYGRDLSVSSAGAEGWMQFLPSSWAIYGVDANGDGYKDPYNPADAIFAAARYLRAAGAPTNLRGAIYSYNHSPAYVESVMLRAKLLGGTPSGLLGAITGLTESRFPVHAKAHFSDGFPTVATGGSPATKTVAATTIYTEANAPVIAVQDGEVVQIGDSPELGHFIALRDAYGNTYTYAKLGSVAQLYPVLEPHETASGSQGSHGSSQHASEPKPTGPASAGTQPQGQGASAPEESTGISALSLGTDGDLASTAPGASEASAGAPTASEGAAATPSAPGSLVQSTPPSPTSSPSQSDPTRTPREFREGPDDVYLHDLHAGVEVIAGTVLGHVGVAEPNSGSSEPNMIFQIRPAGAGAPLIDPKPILDGWVQLENTSVFRAKGRTPFTTTAPSAGQVLLESKEQLERQALANADIHLDECGRRDIETGQIDRRVLATLEFLAVSGLHPTVSALKCDRSDPTDEGNVGEPSTGDAVDISAVNGIPIDGHQGRGSITDVTIRKLLTLQGSMKPHQIISLMSYPESDNTIAKADYYDDIHIGFLPASAASANVGGSLSSQVTPSEWIKLIARLGEIPDPSVANGPSSAAIPDHGVAQEDAPQGEEG
jgi:soluble lytic murein transglycosylase-like protein